MWMRTIMQAAGAASILFVAALGGAPAAAGNPSELACAVEALNPEDRAAITAMLTTRTGDLDGTRRAADEAVSRCSARFGWSESEADAAKGHMAGSLMQAHHRAVLAAAGVDVAWLEREVAADASLIAAAATMSGDPPEYRTFSERVLSRLDARHRDDPVVFYAIGGFVFSTAFLIGEERRFTSK